jgi:hypothetical protein
MTVTARWRSIRTGGRACRVDVEELAENAVLRKVGEIFAKAGR